MRKEVKKEKEKCKICDGKGRILISEQAPKTYLMCRYCSGSGYERNVEYERNDIR